MTEKLKSQEEVVYEKKLMVQLTKTMWQDLRRLAFDLNISMAQLAREGIAYVLNKYKKQGSKK